MKEYLIKPVTTGFFSGSLSEIKMQDFLNKHGASGWKFVKSIHETKRVLGLFKREAHFVIFERSLDSSSTDDQLLAEITNQTAAITRTYTVLEEILRHSAQTNHQLQRTNQLLEWIGQDVIPQAATAPQQQAASEGQS